MKFEAPKPQFTLLPDNTEHVFRVTKFESGYATGGKFAGAMRHDFTLESEGETRGRIKETLFEHEDMKWKLAAFLHAIGTQLPLGSSCDFNRETAKSEGIYWIDPIGRMMRATVKVETVKSKVKVDENGKVIPSKYGSDDYQINSIKLFNTKNPPEEYHPQIPSKIDDDDMDFES